LSKIDNVNNFGITKPTDKINIDIEELETIVIESIDLEILSINGEDIKHITSRMLELYLSYNTFNILTLAGIERLSTLVLENAVFRNYIFNLTNRLLFNLNKEEGYVNNLVTVIADSVSFIDFDKSVFNDPVKQSLLINKNEVIERLMADKWLLTLLLIKLYGRKTLFFQNIFQE